MIELDTLDVLHTAEQSVRSRPFDYCDWRYCACGHIYAATRSGSFAARQTTVTDARSQTFRRVIFETAIALGWKPEDADDVDVDPIDYVSGTVSDYSGLKGIGYAVAARRVIRKAITEIERTRAMDIGEPLRTVRIEPAREPVPQRETQPERRDVPSREPAEPVKAPERDPATIPSR